MEQTRGRRVGSFCALLLASALLLLIFSTCSPLYPTNPWWDTNCFITVARGMRAGLVPYRDLLEQKGPMLYGLHVLALCLPGAGGGFLGVYLLEVLALALFLEAARRIVLLLSDGARCVLPLLISMAAVMLASRAFSYGDSAEELCLPALAWALYDALKCVREGRSPGSACLMRNGFLAGCVFCVKYSLLGLHFGWMAFFAIDALVRDRGNPLRALKMCAIFLAGMALPLLPWLIYFGANGALGDFFGVYLRDNLLNYGSKRSILRRILSSGRFALKYNLPVALLAALGVARLLFTGKLCARGKLCLLAMCAPMLVFVSVSGKGYPYLQYIWAVFAPLGLSALRDAAARLARGREKLARFAVAALAVAVCVACVPRGNMISGIGYPREKLVQVRFAEEIRKTEDPTLLNLGFLDGGFYLAANLLPTQRQFCLLHVNVEACKAEQERAVRERQVDYLVTRDNTLEDLGLSDAPYELVAQQEDDYNLLEGRFTYYLYRRTGLA